MIFRIDFRIWVIVFPIASVIITFISFMYPVFIFHDVIWYPLPAVLEFDLNLLGVLNGDNFKNLLILMDYGDILALISLPGIVIGTIIIIINIFLIVSAIFILINRISFQCTAKFLLILGISLVTLIFIFIITWSFAGDYLLSEIDSSHSFWGDSAKIKLGLIIPFISGCLPIVGYIIIRTKYYKKKTLQNTNTNNLDNLVENE